MSTGRDWTQMTAFDFDTNPKLVQGALFAEPDPEEMPGLFSLDELEAR